MTDRIYRPCIRVIVIHPETNKILLCHEVKDNKIIYFTVPGGGIEYNQSITQAAINECLEEAGILVDNINIISDLTYKYDLEWFLNDPKSIYRGSDNTWVTAKYVREDNSRFNIEGDKLEKEWLTPEEAIQKVNAGPYSIFNKALVDSIDKIKKIIQTNSVAHFLKWK